MDSVGHGPYRDLFPRPVRKQGLENLSAHFPMELAHSIDLPASTDREISHVEGFGTVFRILPSHGEQVIHRDCKLIDCVVAQIRTNKPGIESVETGTHSGMRSEYIPGARDIHGKIEWLFMILHEGARPFENRKRSVALVKVTYPRLATIAIRQCRGRSPASDASLRRRHRAHW